MARVDLRSLQESLAQGRAALDQSEELLSKTRITSPIDGIVIQLDIKVGETVIAGTTNIPGSTMMVIADPSATLTEVQVDEADIAQVREGQRADVFTAAYPDTPLSGTIQSIASVARQTPGQASLSFLVKILMDKQDRMTIRPGMSVRADIYTQTSDETLAIPVQAVLYDEDTDQDNDGEEEQTYVFVMQDGKAIRKDVYLLPPGVTAVTENIQVLTVPYGAFHQIFHQRYFEMIVVQRCCSANGSLPRQGGRFVIADTTANHILNDLEPFWNAFDATAGNTDIHDGPAISLDCRRNVYQGEIPGFSIGDFFKIEIGASPGIGNDDALQNLARLQYGHAHNIDIGSDKKCFCRDQSLPIFINNHQLRVQGK